MAIVARLRPSQRYGVSTFDQQEMLSFHAECDWDAAQIAATPTRREVFAAPPQQAGQGAPSQPQEPPTVQAGAAASSSLVVPVAPAEKAGDEPLESPMQTD